MPDENMTKTIRLKKTNTSLMEVSAMRTAKAKQAVEDAELLNHYLSTAAKHAAGQ